MAASKSTVTWAHAFRDIGVASVNKGQLIAFGFIVIVLLILYRLPSESLAKDVDTLIELLRNHYLWGYILAGLVSAAWFVHAKYLIRTGYTEQDRVAGERNKVQELLNSRGGTTR